MKIINHIKFLDLKVLLHKVTFKMFAVDVPKPSGWFNYLLVAYFCIKFIAIDNKKLNIIKFAAVNCLDTSERNGFIDLCRPRL